MEPRAYTRISKFRQKSYIKTTPQNNVVKFVMGDPKKHFRCHLELISKDECQIRHNALESARQTSNRLLENTLGKKGYFLRIKPYPFHILRENPLAAGAGADRMSTGMKHSFGKAIGSAARIKKGQVLFEVKVPKSKLDIGKLAIQRAGKTLPCACQILINEIAKKK